MNRERLARALDDAARPFGLKLADIDGLKVFVHPTMDLLTVHLKPHKTEPTAMLPKQSTPNTSQPEMNA